MADDLARSATEVRPVSAGAPPAAWASAGSRTANRGSRSVWERYGWLMAVIWLVFLVYPIIALLESDAPQAWIVTGWIGLLSFIVIYIAGFVHGMSGSGGGLTTPPKPIQWWAFVAMIGCGALVIPAVGGNALSFVPFIMSFASYGLTRMAHWITLIAGFVVTAATVLMLPGWFSYLSILVIVAMLGVVNTVSTTLIIRSDQAERLGLELANSEGREAVARDVHDLVGHSLTVVRLKAQLARRLIDSDPERAKAELADIESLTADAISGVRATVAGVRSATLSDQLVASRDALQSAGITLRLDGDLDALSAAQSIIASWILREATTNVLRHAGAETVTVLVRPGSFTVVDDGKGISGAEGNGLRGMRERATTGGGTLAVGSGIDGGTKIEVAW